MGLENRIIYNLVDVIEGNCRIRQALIKDKHYPNLYLLPSAQTRDKSAVSPEQMIKLVDGLKPLFDYIILDCPAGIEQGFRNAIAAADQAIVVTTPEVSAIRDADRIIGLLEADGIRKIESGAESHSRGYGGTRRDDVGRGCAGDPGSQSARSDS